MNNGTKGKIWLAILVFAFVLVVTSGIGYGVTVINNPKTPIIVTPTSTLTPTTSPTVTNTQTPTQIADGRQLFDAYCLQCHRLGAVSTVITKAQLETFIPNHNTGRTLTPEQVAAIVSFLRP
jgi:mono/diheme cytochrome c family protein